MKKILLLIILLTRFIGVSQNYTLDNTFATNGQNTVGGGSEAIELFYIDNKYITVQRSQITCFNYNGSTNESFGINGKILFNTTNTTYIINSAKLSGNFIYVCGYMRVNMEAPQTHQEAFIAKITTQGFFDTTFGNNGISTFLFATDSNNTSHDDRFTDISIQNGGSLFLTGNVKTPSSITLPMVAKVTTAGLLDYTFDINGYKTYTSVNGGYRSAMRILEYGGGFLLFNSYGYNNYIFRLELVKINYNGTYDEDFGLNGIHHITMGEILDCRVLLNDNNLIISTLHYGGRPGNSSSYGGLISVNINSLSNNFPSIEFGSLPYVKVVNNKLLVTDGTAAPVYYNRESNFRVRRLNMDGTLDTTFNGTGTYTHNFTLSSPYPLPAITSDYASCTYVHDDGKILITGSTQHVYIYTGIAMIRIIDSALSTENFTGESDFIVYPNPAKNTLFIKSSLNKKIDSIIITDAMGKLVGNGNGTDSVDVSNLQTGVYTIKIVSGEYQSLNKFIKE
jgi:hypothetical protein